MDFDPQLTAAPSSANFWRITPGVGSPAIDAGIATYSAPFAARGCRPVSTRDIGAEEYGCTSIAPVGPRGKTP